MHQQQMQQQRLLNSSPHHMLQLAAELEVPHSSSSAGTQTEDGGHGHQRHHMQMQMQQDGQQQLGQVAVAANIECSQSQHNYDRDWALDDVVSQISSFRPCPQGSGSMTPFHDSIHNVLEHSEGSSRGSATDLCAGSRQDLSASGISTDTGREHALQLSSFSGEQPLLTYLKDQTNRLSALQAVASTRRPRSAPECRMRWPMDSAVSCTSRIRPSATPTRPFSWRTAMC